MYEPFTEHKFNPIPPKHTAKATQCIRKARNSFARIPGLNEKVPSPRFLLKIPQPNRRINPQAQRCCPLGTFAFPSLGYILASQRSVKAIRTAQKTPLRQPEGNFREHLAGKFYQSRPVLSVKSHIDWQAKWFSAPGWICSQCNYYQIQAPGMNCICSGRTNRVPPPACAIDFSAAAMKQGVVQIGRYYTGWVKYSDQQNSQKSVQLAHRPSGIWEEPVISIVRSLAVWVCEWQNAGDGMSCGTENPSGYEIEKNFCRWSRKCWEKVLNYRIPCRSNNCIHANLPVLSLFPIKTSEGWYAFVDKSLQLAA
jgi:hypothetical protein